MEEVKRRKKRGRKPGAVLNRRLEEIPRKLEQVVLNNPAFEGYVSLADLSRFLGGCCRQVQSATIKAVVETMHRKGCDWVWQADSKGFWIGENPDVTKRREQAEQAQLEAERRLEASPPPSGSAFEKTVWRVRRWFGTLPASKDWVGRPELLKLWGVKSIPLKHWEYFLDKVLRSNKMCGWEVQEDGLGKKLNRMRADFEI